MPMAADELFPVPPCRLHSEQTSLWCVCGRQREITSLWSAVWQSKSSKVRISGLLLWSGTWVSLVSQEMETPPPPLPPPPLPPPLHPSPPQLQWGPLESGPPPLEDDREGIIVEGCSRSVSPAATSAPNQPSHCISVHVMGSYPSVGWRKRFKSVSEFFVFQWKVCVHQPVQLSSSNKVSDGLISDNLVFIFVIFL